MLSHGLDIENKKDCHILVIGDVMLDRYLWGDVKRISPEAPVPVFHIKQRSEVLGGAGNVVSNLVGLGCTVSIIGIIGKDEAGLRVKQLFGNCPLRDLAIESGLQPTITKTRIVSGGQQLIRLDDEDIKPLDSGLVQKVLKSVKENISNFKAIIISDYGKGLFQLNDLSGSIIEMAENRNIPVFVDPKGRNWERYRGASKKES